MITLRHCQSYERSVVVCIINLSRLGLYLQRLTVVKCILTDDVDERRRCFEAVIVDCNHRVVAGVFRTARREEQTGDVGTHRYTHNVTETHS